MKPLTANNNDGRVLLALRAGAMTSGEFSERGLSVSDWLITESLVVQADGVYRITEAGLAACPLRNPLAARNAVPATSSEDESMNKTPQQVFDVIAAAGSSGVKVPEIAARFGMPSADKSIRNALYRLKSTGQVETPEHGLYVIASQGVKLTRSGEASPASNKEPARKVVEKASGKEMHATREAVMAWLEKQPTDVGAMPVAVAQGIGCTEDSTRAVLSGLFAGLKVNRQKIGNDWAYFIDQPRTETKATEACGEQTAKSSPQADLTATDEPQPAVVANTIPESHPRSEIVLPGGDLAIPEKGLGDIVRELVREPMPVMPAIVEDIILDSPDNTEFAIFSSGGLDIYCAETTVTLNKAVLGKLRSFLGLFQEGA